MNRYNIMFLSLTVFVSVHLFASNGVSQEAIKDSLEIISRKAWNVPEWLHREQMRTDIDYAAKKQLAEQGRQLWEEYDRTINEAIELLVLQGDAIVDVLMDELRSNRRDTYFHGRAIEILKRINTPKSNTALWDVAMGKTRVFPRHAAYAYMDNLKDKSQARVFLDSEDQDVVLRALRYLVGVNVDKELLEKCLPYLNATQYDRKTNYSYRMWAASVLASDTGDALLPDKVNAFVNAIKTVKEMPGADVKFQHDWLGTTADNTYSQLTKALMQISGIRALHVEYHLSDTDVYVRLCMEIVLAKLGDGSVRGSIKRAIANPDTGIQMRVLALEAFEKIASEEDVAFLTELAENDTYEVTMIGNILVEQQDSVMLHLPKGSEERMQVEEMLNTKEVMRSMRTNYPVRDEARRVLFAREFRLSY
ncbi:MAG: hypothetical protein GXY06_03760 [Clostridiaceae bacterium]|nr:hypothetical protein [Clostridiaceae bacterium]